MNTRAFAPYPTHTAHPPLARRARTAPPVGFTSRRFSRDDPWRRHSRPQARRRLAAAGSIKRLRPGQRQTRSERTDAGERATREGKRQRGVATPRSAAYPRPVRASPRPHPRRGAERQRLPDAFIKAYGWGVVDGTSQFETCTTTCQAGIEGGGAGELDQPDGIATDPSGNVYVADDVNNRIDEFSAAGAFIKAYGWGVVDGASQFETCTTTCQAGSAGGGAGEFDDPEGVAIDSSGDVYVEDILTTTDR